MAATPIDRIEILSRDWQGYDAKELEEAIKYSRGLETETATLKERNSTLEKRDRESFGKEAWEFIFTIAVLIVSIGICWWLIASASSGINESKARSEGFAQGVNNTIVYVVSQYEKIPYKDVHIRWNYPQKEQTFEWMDQDNWTSHDSFRSHSDYENIMKDKEFVFSVLIKK